MKVAAVLVPSAVLLALVQIGHAPHDPLAVARASRTVVNHEASVPPQCYTRTAGVANPCWTCHTVPRAPNHMDDSDLQREYAFSDFARTNRWTNLFVDRSAAIAATSDDEILKWIRSDNYEALVASMRTAKDYEGYRPDLDLARGFDADGFAVDGSEWRALRYKPFPGTFWPTNGSVGDVFVRLPHAFRADADGRPSRAVHRANFALLEAVLCADPDAPDEALDRRIEPIDEREVGADVDGDGAIDGVVERIHRLPTRYLGGARDVVVQRYVFPEGTEFLHSLRYVDPDAPWRVAQRLKELRYMRKVLELDAWGMQRAYEREIDEKLAGRIPTPAGSATSGLRGRFGWQLQAWIEDAHGRLRLQTDEEHRACMGCHGALGVTADHTFAFARKVPGRDGWRQQDLRSMPDAPQSGHTDPETLTWFRRVGGGDEFRANDEVRARFWRDSVLDEAEVRRAAIGGDRDLLHLVAPSRDRALRLAKAYLAIVREQSFTKGRDAVLGPIVDVFERIDTETTGLGERDLVFRDGRLWLRW